jgi:hypothetical protein
VVDATAHGTQRYFGLKLQQTARGRLPKNSARTAKNGRKDK